jgi:hypothetical protein
MMIDRPATIGVKMQNSGFQLVFGAVGNSVVELESGRIARCLAPQEFKIGLPNPDGKSLIKFGPNGPWLECCVPPPQPGEAYAHQYPFEVFNSKDYPYCEAEWHSPIALLQPNDIITYQQEFQLWADDTTFFCIEREEMIRCMSL